MGSWIVLSGANLSICYGSEKVRLKRFPIIGENAGKTMNLTRNALSSFNLPSTSRAEHFACAYIFCKNRGLQIPTG